MAKPQMKGADAHRSQPSGGPTGGGDGGGGGSSADAPTGNGTTPEEPTSGGATPNLDMGEGGSLLDISPGTKRKLLIGGGVAVGALIIYYVYTNSSSDRGGGRQQPTDTGGDDGGDDGGVKGYPNIEQNPEDPLRADEEALEWLQNPEEKAREAANEEMEEQGVIE